MRREEEVFTMSAREQMELDIVAKIVAGTMSRKQGQQVLDVSERTLRRYIEGYAKDGVVFIKHGNCSLVPTNRTDDAIKRTVQKLVKEKYFDFNMTHCLEKLENDENISIKRETFRKWCHEIKMVKKAKRRRAKVRRLRQRMQQAGLMLQMDGSPHHWFGGRPSCLVGAIDDADSDVPYAEFFPAEDTISCMRVIHKIIEKKGVFQILYVDRAGIFGGQKRSNFSQVKRALRELGIHIIFANSPEAKGRIERLWQTFQDRLVPELRIRNIRSYENANHFLQEQFLPNEYAPKFKITPENLQSAYKPIPDGVDLWEIFCLKEYRSVKRDHTFSVDNELYQIDSPLKHSIYKQSIEMRTYQDLSRRFFFAGKEIEVSQVDPATRRAASKRAELAEVDQIYTDKVRMDGHIAYLSRYYSVDEKFIGTKVSVAEKDDQVLICQLGKVIEMHPKIKATHETHSTKPEHLGPWKRALDRSSIYRQAAIRLGPDVDRFILTVLERGQGVIDNATIWGILKLDRSYHPHSINEACRYALELDSYTYRAVQLFLKLQGNRYEQSVRSQHSK